MPLFRLPKFSKADDAYMISKERNLLEQVVFIHAKIAVILWAIAYSSHASAVVAKELGWGLIYVSAILAIVGSVMGIGGLIMSYSNKIIRRHRGNVVEFAGLVIAVCGPITYCITIAALSFKIEFDGFLPLGFFAYALVAFMLSRIVTVWTHIKEMMA